MSDHEGEDPSDQEGKEQDPSIAQEEGKEGEGKENLNIKRVLFTQPTVDYICHPHASSLLAQDEPLVPLTQDLQERAEKIFSSYIESEEEPSGEAAGRANPNEPQLTLTLTLTVTLTQTTLT